MTSTTHHVWVICIVLIFGIIYRFMPLPLLDACTLSYFIPLYPIHSSPSVSAPPLEQYIVLIDAGSSGTRVHVHRVDSTIASSTSTSATPQMMLPLIQPSLSYKIKPGLTSSHYITTQQAAKSLWPLIEFAHKQVREELRHVTPLYLFGTAGLRSWQQDPYWTSKADEVWKACQQVLSSSDFDFRQAKIISGQEEGIYGWIAANYLLGYLQEIIIGKKTMNESVGVLEMGGASFQLTFAPTGQSLAQYPTDSLVQLQLVGSVFSLFTASFLNFGLEKAQELYNEKHALLLSERDPCFPAGLSDRAKAQGHYDDCLTLVDAIIHDQAVHKLDDDILATNVDDETIALSTPYCSKRPCPLSSDFIPRISKQQRFIAIENFFYTAEFFGLSNRSHLQTLHELDLHSIKAAGRQFCNMSWNEVSARYPSEPINDLRKYCFSAAYLPRVLELGLGLEQSRKRHEDVEEQVEKLGVHLLHNVNGAALDWALGAVLMMLSEKNRLDVKQEIIISDGQDVTLL